MSVFEEILAKHAAIVADGAMGTALFARGLEVGGCPELANVDSPEMIAAVHRDYLEAGADLILTNTFGGNARRLMLHDAADRVRELNAAAARLARQVADEFARPVIVAGSVGPTGDLMVPLGPLTHEAAVEVFTEQMAGLVAGGVDVLWIETLSSQEEAAAATEAAQQFDVPVTATLSFDTVGKTMMGWSPAAFADWAADTKLAAVGGNCGIGPGDNVVAIHEITNQERQQLVISKGNCGIPLYKNEGLEYPAGPESMADYVEMALRSGVKIIGACCGSTPAHIAAIRRAVDAYVAGERPSREEIVTRLDVQDRPTPSRTRTRRRSA